MFSSRDIITRLLLLLVLVSSAAVAHAQFDPTNQINWPKTTITGSDSPIQACSSSNYGQPFQRTDVTPNKFGTCGADGWQYRGVSSTASLPSCADTSGSGSAQSCTLSPLIAVAPNMCVLYTTTTANSGTGLTLNVTGSGGAFGAASVAKWLGATTLAANDVKANQAQVICLNSAGTAWNLSTIGNAPTGGGGGLSICADSSGSGSIQSCTTSPSFSPVAGSCVAYTTTTANSGASLTLNVNSSGAKNVVKWLGSASLNAGDIQPGKPYIECYDGTSWNLQAPLPLTASLGLNGVSRPLMSTWAQCLANAANQVCHIAFIGDSYMIEDQTNASTGPTTSTNRWVEQIRLKLQNDFGYGGTGIQPLVFSQGPGPGVNLNSEIYPSASGTLDRNVGTLGPSGGSSTTTMLMHLNNASSVTYSAGGLSYDTFYIYCMTNSTSGSLAINIDSGAHTGTACGTTSGSATAHVVSLSAGTLGTHTVTVTSTGDSYVYAMEGTAGSTGVRVSNMGWGGAMAQWWWNSGNGLAFSDLEPAGTQAAVIMLQTNEINNSANPTTNFNPNLTSLVTHEQGLTGSPSVLLVVPPVSSASGTFTAAQYTAQQYLVQAANNTELVNIQWEWGPALVTTTGLWASGNLHPNDKGNLSEFSQVYPKLVETTPPTISGSTGTSVKVAGGSPLSTYNLNGNVGQACNDTSGSGSAQNCTTATSFSPAAGVCWTYTTTTTNSGTGLTVNVNSFGAKSVAVPGSSGWTTTLVASTIPVNKPLAMCYDGANMDIQNLGIAGNPTYFAQATATAGGTTTALTVSPAPLTASLLLFKNGAVLKPGTDWTISGSSVTLASNTVNTDAWIGQWASATNSTGSIGFNYPAIKCTTQAGGSTSSPFTLSLSGCSAASGDAVLFTYLAHGQGSGCTFPTPTTDTWTNVFSPSAFNIDVGASTSTLSSTDISNGHITVNHNCSGQTAFATLTVFAGGSHPIREVDGAGFLGSGSNTDPTTISTSSSVVATDTLVLWAGNYDTGVLSVASPGVTDQTWNTTHSGLLGHKYLSVAGVNSITANVGNPTDNGFRYLIVFE